MGIDVVQDTLSSWLYQNDTGKRFADAFNGKEKIIKDLEKKDYHKITVLIKKCSIDDFKQNVSKSKAGKFVLDGKAQGDGKGKHCLYASDWKDNKLHCITTAGTMTLSRRYLQVSSAIVYMNM